MKSRIFFLVKRLWPLAAFTAAACLVVVFIYSQRAITQEATPEEQYRKNYRTALRIVRKLAAYEHFTEALDKLEAVFDEYSELYDSHLHLEAAELCLKATPARFGRALEHADRFIATHPDSEEIRRAFEIRGEVLFEKGRYEEAVKAYRKSIEGVRPTRHNARARGRIGRCYYYLGDHINAEQYLQTELDLSVDYREPSVARFLLGEIYSKRFVSLGKDVDAERAIDYFWRIFDDTVNPDLRYAARVRTGDLCLALGKYKDAEEAYLAALEVIPSMPEMRQWLRGGEEIVTRDDLIRLQVFGRPRTFVMRGDKVVSRPASKMCGVLQHHREAGDIHREIEDLERMARALDNKQETYLEIARRYDDLALEAKQGIEAVGARLRVLRRGLGGRMLKERIFRAERELKAKIHQRDEYLRLAAEYYERGFDEDRYAGTTFKAYAHPLWKAAQRLFERRDYAGAERVFLQIIRPELRFEKELLLESLLSLGGMYRELGRNDEALGMFRRIIEDRKDEGGQLRALAVYEEAATLAVMGEDAAAENAFRVLMRDDNPYGIGIYSKIWRDSAFALGKLRYHRAVAGTSNREKKLTEVVETLTDALERYKSFIDGETRNRSLFFVGDSLHHLALAAMGRGENQKARELLAAARKFLGQIEASDEPPAGMPVYFRNGRLVLAETFAFESRMASDDAEKEKLLKEASAQYAVISRSMEGTEQGLWALIQLGRMARELGDRFTARRYFDLAASGIVKLREKNNFADNPKGFDAAYLEKILDWLRSRDAD